MWKKLRLFHPSDEHAACTYPLCPALIDELEVQRWIRYGIFPLCVQSLAGSYISKETAQKFYTCSEKFIWDQWKHRREPGMGEGLVVTEDLIKEVALGMSLGT